MSLLLWLSTNEESRGETDKTVRQTSRREHPLCVAWRKKHQIREQMLNTFFPWEHDAMRDGQPGILKIDRPVRSSQSSFILTPKTSEYNCVCFWSANAALFPLQKRLNPVNHLWRVDIISRRNEAVPLPKVMTPLLLHKNLSPYHSVKNIQDIENSGQIKCPYMTCFGSCTRQHQF